MSVEQVLFLLLAIAILHQTVGFYASLACRLYEFASPLLQRMVDALRRTAIPAPHPARKPVGGHGLDRMTEDTAIRIVELLASIPGQRKSACVGAVRALLAELIQERETVRAGARVRNVPPGGGKDIVWLEG